MTGEWRPIETAPKNWETVLIAGRYANGTPYVEASYRHYGGHYNARKLEPPTHWMPMPEPPGELARNAMDALTKRGK